MMLAKASKLDFLFRKLLLTKFFTKGWGTVENLKRMCEFGKVISDRSKCKHLVDNTYPIYIDKNEKRGECRVLEGHFLSPFAKYMKGMMPKEVETARFQVILPLTWKSDKKPICIQLAGTGDHGFWWRRTIMARPLLKEYGIASIILENPFYGERKPKGQVRSSLHNVNDLFVMGGALILETLTLLHWCEKEGYGPLGISGISMGGHMATLAATNWHKPIALVPCLSWSNATPTFTEGVMSGAIPWQTLASEYVFHSEYEAQILRKLMKCPEHDAYKLGQEFAANFPESIEELKHVSLKSGLRTPGDKATSGSTPTPSEEKESDVNRQSPQCNAASSLSSVSSNGDAPQNPSIAAQPHQHQNDSIPDTSVLSSSTSASSSSSGATCQTFETARSSRGAEGSATHEAHDQGNRAIDGDGYETHSLDGGGAVNSRDTTAAICHSRTESDSSGTNNVKPKINQEAISQRSDANKQDSASVRVSKAKEQRSKAGAGVRVESLWTKSGRSRGKTLTDKAKWKLSKEEFAAVKQEALHFMEGVMDASTFVGNFSKPVDPELVLSVLAKQDAYIPWYQMPSLQELFPGMEVRFVNSGHVAAILFKQHHFRRAINDAFQKMERKYKGVFPEES